MSLTETIKELKEEIAGIEENPEPAPESAPDSAPEPAPEPAPKEEEKEDASAFQRMRRETAAAKKRADDAEARLAERDKKEEPLLESAPEIELPSDIAEIVETHRLSKAEKEFTQLERKFSSKEKDYEAISSEYAGILATSIKVQNPRMSNIEVAEKTKETILRKAANFLTQGYDPIEELYHEAKELGCTGKSAVKPEPKEEEEIKPDMKKVAENRKRSAGMAATGGESKGQITKQAAADFTNAEWAKLSKIEKQRLLTT